MKKYLMMLFVALAVGFQSCDNNDDLWNAIDDLKSRVQALETQVTALNGNVEALKTLYGGATISKVDNKAGVYTITLSNGETIVLTQGSDAKAVIPVMSINADGFWQVSYDSGKTFTSLGVKATATDGVTPKFRIEEKSGFWQVSYDNGTKYDYVLDAAGQKVSAIGDATVTDKFFQAVAVKDGKFEVTMLDGSKLSIPILSDFYCRFASIPTDVQTFAAGDTKRFAVEIKGVDNTIVTAPDGWTAMLTDIVADKAELVITAPAAGTRATADNSKDVSILATAGSYACIAKLQVASNGVAPVPPTVAVANSTTTLPTASALTFDVTLSANAESWHYICQKSSVAAPEVAAVLAGTLGTGTSATVTGLEASTAYKIYVVATAGELNSTLATVEITTAAPAADPNDYYETGVTIDGVKYDKNTAGVQLLTDAATKIEADGVYFLDPTDAATKFTLTGKGAAGYTNLVIIGRYATKKPVITLTDYISLNGATEDLKGIILKNIATDTQFTTVNYLINTNGTGAFDHLIIEDCMIETANDKSVGYFSSAASIGKFILRNNKIHMNVSATGKTGVHIFGYGPNFVIAKTNVFDLSNNVIYANSPTTGAIINGANTVYNASMTINISNNTLINYLGVNAYVVIKDAATVTMNKNLMWSETLTKVTCYLFRLNDNLKHVTFTLTDNCIYGGGSWTAISGTNMPQNYTESPKLEEATVNPFAGGTFTLETGTFIPAAAYAAYGSTLK